MKIKAFNLTIEISFIILLILSFLLYINKKIILISVVSSLIHESGHILALICFGKNITKIKIDAFIFTITKNYTMLNKNLENLLITISGPILNLMVAIVAYFFYIKSNKCSNTLYLLSINNFFLFILNICPVKNLDGGNLLYNFLLKKTDPGTASKILDIFSLLFVIPFAIFGFIISLKNKYNFSLLALCIYLLFMLIFNKNSIL